MPQHRHNLDCIDGKTGLLVCPASRRPDSRGYRTLEAAARAFAKAIGAYGSPGGWIYSPAGRPIAQGWFAYGRQLVDRGHVVRRATDDGAEIYVPRFPSGEASSGGPRPKASASACYMSKEHGQVVTGQNSERHGVPSLIYIVRQAKSLSAAHPTWTVTVYENPTGSCAEHVPLYSYRNGKRI